MFHGSISRLLISLQTIILTGLVAAVSIFAFQAWQDFSAAQGAEEAVRTDRIVFDSVIDVRGQISPAQTAIQTQDNPQPKIDEVVAKSDAAVAKTVEAINDIELDGKAEMLAELDRRIKTMKGLESILAAEAAKPMAERTLEPTMEWRAKVYDSIDALVAMSTVMGNVVRLQDPFLAEMVQVRRLGWMIRDKYGQIGRAHV